MTSLNSWSNTMSKWSEIKSKVYLSFLNYVAETPDRKCHQVILRLSLKLPSLAPAHSQTTEEETDCYSLWCTGPAFPHSRGKSGICHGESFIGTLANLCLLDSIEVFCLCLRKQLWITFLKIINTHLSLEYITNRVTPM